MVVNFFRQARRLFRLTVWARAAILPSHERSGTAFARTENGDAGQGCGSALDIAFVEVCARLRADRAEDGPTFRCRFHSSRSERGQEAARLDRTVREGRQA